MKKWVSIFISMTLGSALFGIEEGQFSATDAEYNGKELALTGGVIVDHAACSLSAECARFSNPQLSNRWHFNVITLEGGVTANFHDGGKLGCSWAKFNDQQSLATFWGEPLVTYKSGGDLPVVLKSQRMDSHIVREGKGKLFKSAVSTISAEGEVIACYNYDFVAKGDRALYRRCDGTLTLEGDQCRVTSSRGDVVDASCIDLDTVRRRLTFLEAKAELNYGKEESVKVTGEKVIWKEGEQMITLYGHGELTHDTFGTITTEEQLNLIAEKCGGKQQLSKVETFGQAYIEHSNKEGGGSTLTCEGSIVVDYVAGIALLKKGIEQVHYKDRLGELYADTMTLNYTNKEGRLILDRLLLTGNVRMVNSIGTKEGQVALQYALADRVELIPETEEVTLSMFEERGRILFFDKVNQIKMSASGIKIRRDGTTNTKEIQGLGDVRFRFFDHEFEQLKERFHFESLNLG